MSDFDRRLEESLKSVSAALRASRVERLTRARADFRTRLRRRRVARFASLAAATAVLAAVTAIAATVGTDIFEGGERTPRVDAPPAGTYIRVGDDPVGVSITGDVVWVASRSGVVTRVNATTKSSIDVINVGGEPSDIALSGDRAWVADVSEGAVKSLDGTTGGYVFDPTSVGSQGRHIDVDAGPRGTIWATSYDSGALVGINPADGNILNRLFATAPTELAIAGGGIWTLADDGATLVRLDFETGAESLRVPVGDGEKTDMAVTPSSAYVAEADGTVLRIDASTGAIAARASVEGARPELALGRGGLWVASDTEGVNGKLEQLGLGDLRRVGKSTTFAGAPTDMAFADGAIWIADTGRETVVRLKAPR